MLPQLYMPTPGRPPFWLRLPEPEQMRRHCQQLRDLEKLTNDRPDPKNQSRPAQET